MGVLFRIVVSFGIIWMFLIIFFMSFFSQPRYFDLPELSQNSFSGAVQLETSSWAVIYKKQYDAFHTLYTDSQDEVAMTSDGIGLEIHSGARYVSSFRDMGKKYSFQWSWYSILQEGIGEVFIDTFSVPGRVFVMPISTSVKVSLESSDKKENYTDIFLTPHMYLEFQPARGKSLKNADSVRVATIFKLWYVGERITDESTDTIFAKYRSGEKDLLEVSLNDIYENDQKYQDVLQEMLEKQVGKIPWYDTIQRYIHLFVNVEKQKIFYKNLILENIIVLLSEETFDASKVSTIRKDLDTLKSIDEVSYNNMIVLIRDMQAMTISSYGRKDIIPQMYFWVLGSGESLKDSWYFALYGFNLFSLYDSGANFSSHLFAEYLSSFSSFVNLNAVNSLVSTLRYQYFSYSLEQQIHFLLETVGVEQISFINYILEEYLATSQLSYSESVTQKVTALYVYNELLKKLDNFLRNESFLTGRSAEGVLLLNPDNKIQTQDIERLEQQVDVIFDTYNNNEKFLDPSDLRDQSIKQEMKISQNHLDEYFQALENYESYENKYNIVKQSISNVDIYGYQDDIVISIDEARSYLSQFVWLSFSDSNIQIIDDIYYSITDAYVAGKRFSFNLHPYDEYKMESIIIDSEKKNFVYKLGRLQWIWEEKFQTALRDQKDQYDFSRFFLITFFPKDDASIEIYSTDDTRYNEDKTEIIFKRDTLLWEKGEFSTVRDVVTIEYDDIRLEQNNEGYDIFITDTDVYFEYTEDRANEKVYGELDAEYILNKDEHYFTQIDIVMIDEIELQEKKYLFGWENIQVIWKLHIWDFSQSIKHVFQTLLSYKWIYNAIINAHGQVNVSMQYTLRNDKMSFKFDSAGKTYTILLEWDKIVTIYKDTQKIIDEPTSLQDIALYLQ